MCQTAPAFLASVARRHPASLKLVLQSLPEGQNVRCTLEFRELHTLVTIKRQLHRQQGLTMEELLTQLRNAARAKAKEQQQKLPPDEQSTFDFDTAVWQECPDPGFRQTLMDHCQQWECLTQLAQCDMLSYAMRKADAPQQQAQQQQQQACQQQAAADQQQQQQAGVQPAGQQQQVRPTVAELEAEPGQHIAGVIDRSIKRTLLCKQWREALPDLAAGAPAELGGLGILTGSFRPAWRVHGQDQPYYDSDIKDGDFCIPMDLALLPCYGRYKRGRTTDDDEDESQDSNRKKKKRKRSCVTEVGKKPWEKHHLQAHNTGYVWVYVGAAETTTGQGQKTKWESKRELLHRLLCLAWRGPPADDSYEVCHTCQHKWCVNPRHLVWASHRDNYVRYGRRKRRRVR